VGVDYRVARAGGVHPTTYADWTEVVDEAGQTAAEEQNQSARIGHYTAKGDVIGVRWRVYVGGSLTKTDSTVTTSSADYWRWWNYEFPFVLSIDDGLLEPISSIDSLLAVMEGEDGIARKFTASINAVHTYTLADTIAPLSATRRATPTQLATYHDNGYIEIANHGYSAASLYSQTIRGSFNTGGLISAADTVRAANADYWPGEFKASWGGDYDTGDMHAYYSEATDELLTGYGLIHDTDSGSLEWSPWTIEEHMLAEIERDSLVAFGIVPSISDVKTFVWPSYEYGSDLFARVEAEGYLGCRGALDGNAAARNDVTSDPVNEWGALSIFRVPVGHDIFTWLDHTETEGEFKTAMTSDITTSGVEDDGGMFLFTTMHYTRPTHGASYVEPEEIRWAIEAAEAAGGITVSLGEALEYFRARARYAYLAADGDRVYRFEPQTGGIFTAVASSDVSTAREGAAAAEWPAEPDLTITDVAYTAISPAIGDSTTHLSDPTGTSEARVVADEEYSGGPELYYPDHQLVYVDLSSLPAGADVTSCELWLRAYYTSSGGLQLGASDVAYAAWSHAAGDNWFETTGGAGYGTYEAHATWVTQDGTTAWSPTMSQREFQTSWRTLHSITGPVSDANGSWRAFDLTAGAEAVVEEGRYNGGIQMWIIDNDTGVREEWRWESFDGTVANQIMWFKIEYSVESTPYATLVGGNLVVN
jgi:hypothetical protein